MATPVHHSDTRQQLLRAALKHFANSGYAATSVQDIVDDGLQPVRKSAAATAARNCPCQIFINASKVGL